MAGTSGNMRAVIIENIGKPRALKHIQKPRPQIGADAALIRIHATSVNPGDLLLRSGRLIIRKPLPHILGADLAGEIVEIGADAAAAGWQIGERVYACFEPLGCAIDGGYAEYCAVPAEKLIRLPAQLDYQAAVAAGASFASAFLALVEKGKLQKAEAVVIRGAAGSVGAAAVQIASARGAKVIAIGAAQFAADFQKIGAHVVLEDASDDLVRQVQVATEESGADLVLHCSNQLDLEQSLDMLAYGGRLVIASAARRPQVKLDALALYLKNLSISGAYGSLPPQAVAALLQALAEGKYQTLIDEVLPLSQARQAHRKLERKPRFGKIILVPDAVLAELEAAKKPSNWIPIE